MDEALNTSPETTRETELQAQPESTNGLTGIANRDSLSGLLMAIGILGVTAILIRSNMKRRRQRLADTGIEDLRRRLDAQANGFSVPEVRDVSQVEHAMAEASEVSRRLAANLDNRARRLELLIDEADAKIEQLRRASASAQADEIRKP